MIKDDIAFEIKHSRNHELIHMKFELIDDIFTYGSASDREIMQYVDEELALRGIEV